MPVTSFTFGDPTPNPAYIPAGAGSIVSLLDYRGGRLCTIGNSLIGPPVWTAFTFAPAVVGVAYSEDFDLAPSASPTTYTLASGSLPPGLSVASVSGDVGNLSGTPTTAGVYTFTLRATNQYGTADKTFSLTVTATGGSSGGGAWIAIT